MNKHLILSVIIISLIASSCGSKLVRVATTSHKEIMDNYKNKEVVISKFGLPTSKKSDGDYEEWEYLYNVKNVTEKNANVKAMFGSSNSKSSSSSANVVGAGGMAYANSSGSAVNNTSGGGAASASAKSVTQEVRTFVKFTFKGDNMVTWSSNGVDYAIYEMIDLEKQKKEKEQAMKENEKNAKKNKKKKK